MNFYFISSCSVKKNYCLIFYLCFNMCCEIICMKSSLVHQQIKWRMGHMDLTVLVKKKQNRPMLIYNFMLHLHLTAIIYQKKSKFKHTVKLSVTNVCVFVRYFQFFLATCLMSVDIGNIQLLTLVKNFTSLIAPQISYLAQMCIETRHRYVRNNMRRGR